MTVRYERTSGITVPTYDIMLDIDDVQMPWFETVDRHCAEAWAYDGSLGRCNVWSMHDFYGRTREEWEDVVIHATINGLYTTTDPFPGVVEGVNGLLWRGNRIHMVTARGFMANGENIRRWTPEWLETYGIGYTTLTFAKNKVKAMRELGVKFDYALDDGVHNYEDLTLAGVPTWLHDAPHNEGYESPRRVASLWEFAQMVHQQQTLSASLITTA